MFALKRAMIGFVVVVSIALILTRPIYIAYAAFGILIALGGRFSLRGIRRLYTPWPGFGRSVSELAAATALVFLPLVLLSILSVENTLGLVVVGVVLVAGAVWLWRVNRKKASFRRILLLTIVPLALVGLSYVGFLRVGAPRPFEVHYTGKASIEKSDWAIKHEITIAKEQTEYSLGQESQGDKYILTKHALEKCGWKEEVEGTFSILSTQPVASRWVPFKTVDSITFPQMRCADMLFASDTTSSFTLSVPRFEIAKTDPVAKTRTERLVGEDETIVLPISFNWEQQAAVQVQVVSPILRNRLGDLFLSGAAWEPIKWAVLVVCGLFADQIKKGLIVPFVKWIFKLLKLPYKDDGGDKPEGEEGDEPPEAASEPGTA
jgi:hypothetical protein